VLQSCSRMATPGVVGEQFQRVIPPLLTGGAVVLDEAALASVGPVAVQDQPIFLVRKALGESFAGRIDVDILLSHIAEVLLAEARVGFGVRGQCRTIPRERRHSLKNRYAWLGRERHSWAISGS
jgi:hypothetical protein